MQRLDRSLPFGTIAPPWSGDNDELPRPAFYEQGGRLFDAHDLEIVPGKKTKRAASIQRPEPPPVEEPDEEEDDEPLETAAAPAMTHSQVVPPGESAGERVISPAELIDMADRMPFAKFATEAKRILGATCPKSKQAIVIALQEAIAAYEKRYGAANGLTWGGVTQQTPKAPKGPPPAPPAESAIPAATHTPIANPPKPNGVDLQRWARGKQEYLWAEVAKAIRQQYGKQIAGEHARKDAVDFLIGERVITAAEARKDV